MTPDADQNTPHHLDADIQTPDGSESPPQGWANSPFLFRSINPAIIYSKFLDKTVIMDTTYSPGQLQTEMDTFSGWCTWNYLDLNSFKTKK